MSGKFTGSGRQREGGKAAVHRHDFNVHTSGTDWRHTADQTDMNPAIDILAGAFSSPDVQGTLEKLATYFSTIGQGFISIGDGYEQGDYNVGDPSTPTLKDAFDEAFTNVRLQSGGIILVKAGTYVLTDTVTLPPGIMVIGESRGTIIISHTLEQPMFQIQAGLQSPKMGDLLGQEQTTARPIDGNKFFNLTLVDNLDGYIESASVPIPTMQTVPMIRCAGGSVLELDQITFIGKLQEGFPVDQRPPITRSIVGYNSPAASIGSTLIVERCFIDGFGVGIEFTPGQGELDFLTVDKCRARTYGRLDANLTTTNNCFIAMTMCNATITNNYHISTGVAGTENPENFIAHVGTYTPGAIRARVVVSGNTGGPAGGAHDNEGTSTTFCLMRGFSGQHIGAVAANSWGNHIGSEWYITVSPSGSSTTDALEGDIVGTNALEFVINNLDDNGTTIILNPGTHILTTVPSSIKRFKIIGNKHGSSYPVVSLTLTGSAPTVFTNKSVFLGNYIKSVVFDGTSASAYRGVRVHWSDASTESFRGTIEIDDCIFRNVGLVCIDSSAASLADRISISVKSCVFNQTGAFGDNFSMLLPEANIVRVQDCVFTGNGYVGGIGSWAAGYTGMSGHGAAAAVQILVDNCLMDLTDNTISTGSVLGRDRYFVIDSEDCEITLTNTKILTDNTRSGLPQPIDLSLETTFFAFLELRGKNVRVDNCEINGPAQFFDIGGTDYAMPAVSVIIPQFGAGFWMRNSLISGASLPMQILNSAFYDNSSVRLPANNIYLDSCELKTWNDGYCNTVLDIDVLNDAGTILDAPTPQIMLKNCQFTAYSDSAFTQLLVFHNNHSGAYYNINGTVQIYANGWAAHVTDCKILGTITTTGVSGSFVDHWAGLLINVYNGPATNGSVNSKIFVSNNDIIMANTNGDASSTSAAVWLTGWHMQVCNNFIGVSNLDSGGTNNVVCMYIENIASGVYLDALIQGNVFDRLGTNLRGGYVIIDAASAAGGLLCNNKFSAVTFNGASTALVDDNTTAPFWIIDRNINQTATAAITSSTGMLEIDQTSIGYTATSHDFKPDETTGNQVYRLQISAGSVTSIWSVDLGSVLPPNTQVVSASSTLSFSGSGTPSGTVTLNLVNATSDDSASGSVPAGGAITVNAGAVADYLVNSTQHPVFYANFTLAETGGSALVDAILTPIIVTYRW